LSNIYFVRINLSHVIPSTISNAQLLNTIAQSIGLHDYYQFGLWGYCEGNVGVGITYCSKPETLYWFNPVEIITSELLAGATSKFNIHTHEKYDTRANIIQSQSQPS
jgi:hypothetical protein